METDCLNIEKIKRFVGFTSVNILTGSIFPFSSEERRLI